MYAKRSEIRAIVEALTAGDNDRARKLVGLDIEAVQVQAQQVQRMGQPYEAVRSAEDELRLALGDDDLAKKLIDAGYTSIDAVNSATDEQLEAINGIGGRSREKVRKSLEPHKTV